MADIATLTALSTAEWDESKPSGSRDVNLGDDDIREFKEQIRERIAVDHNIFSDESGQDNLGAHKAIHLLVTTTPFSLANAGVIYTKDVNGKAECFWLDEDSNEVQLTSGGKIFGDNVKLSNNVNLIAKDAAGTGTVNLIKANASDKPEVPDGSVLASSAAPTVDAGISNKKYVDDQIIANKTAFGSWSSKSAGVEYTAATDGLVVASAYSTEHRIESPTGTERSYFNASGAGGIGGLLFCPVRKGDTWKATGSNFYYIYWLPTGS